MRKQLFFDDQLLFGRDGVNRVPGIPELIDEYSDGICSTDFCTANTFRLDDGKYRMLYFGHSAEFEGKKLLSAISDDGVHFVPEETDTGKTADYPHEIMTLPNGAEVATIYEDPHGSDERYKLLMAEFDSKMFEVVDSIYVSNDLIHWKKKESALWGDGAEPLTSVYYDEGHGQYVIVERPFWGCRLLGYKTTEDWQSFSEYRYMLGVDSEDEALSEIYGMYAFEYDGMYIGFPHMYRGLSSERNAKYKGGKIECDLAYSYDGAQWRRGPRVPFVSGGKAYPLVWLASMLRKDSSILLYGSASELEHGNAFQKPGCGKIFIYRLREDGFVALQSDGNAKSRVITREKLWNGGELHLNVNAKNVTVGIYETKETENVPGNALGFSEPIEGYGAEDCIPFSGDSTDHTPRYKSGRSLADLAGRTLVFEINFENGALYSLFGDYVDLYNTEGAIYRMFGTLPKRKY